VLVPFLLAGAVAGILLVAVVTAWRRDVLSRRVGSFTCTWCPQTEDHTAEVPGIAHFSIGRLEWHRTISLARHPAMVWFRDDLELVDRRLLAEVDELGRQVIEVGCRHRSDSFTLTMPSAAYAGLVSWLESCPRNARVQ
jgi:hypothetical protein